MRQAQDAGQVCGLTALSGAGGQLDASVFRKVEQLVDAATELFSAPRQASKIGEEELTIIMRRLKVVVIWQEEDPDLSELLGPPPWKGGMWYSLILDPSDAEVPLQMADEIMLSRPA